MTGTSPGRACSPLGQWETFWILQLLGTRSFSFHSVVNYAWFLYWQQRLINILQVSLRSSIPQSISPALLSSHSHSLREFLYPVFWAGQEMYYSLQALNAGTVERNTDMKLLRFSEQLLPFPVWIILPSSVLKMLNPPLFLEILEHQGRTLCYTGQLTEVLCVLKILLRGSKYLCCC